MESNSKYLKDCEIKSIINIMINANMKIMEIYDGEFDIIVKQDMSPLTVADLKANKIICQGLKDNFKWNIISEENKMVPYDVRKEWDIVWLVDPIDGTKEFIKRNGQFTTNIGLSVLGMPVFGFVGIPCENKVYYGGIGYGSYCYDYVTKTTTKLSPKRNNPLKVVASNSHMNQMTKDFIDNLPESKEGNIEIVSFGSSIKILKLATGEADIYPRIAPTSEWDTCAADAVLRGVGGKMIDYNTKKLLTYNKENILNPYFIGYNNI